MAKEYKFLNTRYSNLELGQTELDALNKEAQEGWEVKNVEYVYDNKCTNQKPILSHKEFLLEREKL